MASRDARVRFVVNADDLGASSSINAAILSGISQGVITSSTVMANGPALDEAIREMRGFPNASFGVHMNLTEHRPLTANPDLRPLLAEDGSFARRAIYGVRWTRRLLDAVVAEWTEQVTRIARTGIRISHLDSHEHVHTIPGLFIALKRVERRTGIRRIRGTWSIYDRETMPGAGLLRRKKLWSWALRNAIATRTTDEFSDFLIFLSAVSDGSYAPSRWPRTIELMVHPGGPPERDAREAAALRSDWLRSLPVAGELITYHDV